MELLQLRYFYESSINENFARTAQKYMVPPSSVSAAVKRLEDELGVELFDRTRNRITLNTNGRKLQQSLNVVFDELSKTVNDFKEKKTDIRDIKLLVRAMRGRIADYTIEYKSIHPEINFKTVYNFEEKEYEKYDIIIDEKTECYPSYGEFHLDTLRIRMRASANHPLCNKKLTLSQLSDQSFVSMGEHSNMHKILIKACRRSGFVPKITVQSNDSRCYLKSIAAGIGIGPASDYLNADNENYVTYLDVSDFDEQQIVCAYYNKATAYGNVKEFLDFLTEKSKFL